MSKLLQFITCFRLLDGIQSAPHYYLLKVVDEYYYPHFTNRETEGVK